MKLGEVGLLTNDVIRLANFYKEHKKIIELGAEIIEKPVTRPWGVRNMSFYDPDRNIIYLRSILK